MKAIAIIVLILITSKATADNPMEALVRGVGGYMQNSIFDALCKGKGALSNAPQCYITPNGKRVYELPPEEQKQWNAQAYAWSHHRNQLETLPGLVKTACANGENINCTKLRAQLRAEQASDHIEQVQVEAQTEPTPIALPKPTLCLFWKQQEPSSRRDAKIKENC